MVPTESSRVVRVAAPPPGQLGKSELYALSIGQVIGAGIITTVGPAIALTGQSAWFAYAVAIVLGFFMIVPIVFLTSTLRLGGGYYSMLAGLAGEKVAGMYAVASLTGWFAISLFGVALGIYAHAIWPVLNPQVVGIVLLTFFYVINLLGVSSMARAQKAMTWFLIAALLMFILVGLPKITNPVFSFGSANFFSGGFSGFMAAVFLFAYSCTGYSMTMNYGRDAKNAKRDIPWALLVSVPTLIVLYCGVALVDSGVLPLAQVVNQPLTVIAKQILPPILFVVFMIGGPIMALSTTMNSSLAAMCVPVAQSCKDGWLPKGFAKTSKRGSYYLILTAVYLVGLIPILLKFNVSTIIQDIMLFNAVLSFLYSYAYYQLPTKYPEAWVKSRFHVPNWVYYTIVTLSLLAYVAVFINSARTLTPAITIVSLVVIVGCLVFGLVRSRSPNVHVVTSLWDD